MENEKKAYFAIIPANVRYDKRLKANAKLLYGEITALTNEKGFCWARNSYFAELYGVSKNTISLWINQLKEFGYIHIEIIYKEGTKEIKDRYIQISGYPIIKNSETPIIKKGEDNNTVINNTINNTERDEKSLALTTQSLELCKYYQMLKPNEMISSYIPTLNVWIEMYTYEWVKEAIQMCVSSKNKFIKPWIEKVLKNWTTEGKEVPYEPRGINKQSTSWNYKPPEREYSDEQPEDLI